MADLVASVAIAVSMAMLLVMVQARFAKWERPWLWGSLLVHYLAGVAQVLVVTEVYEGGDMIGFGWYGSMLARFLLEYPLEGSYRLLQVFFYTEQVPLPLEFKAGATGSMYAISGFVMLVTNGSIYAACVLFGGLTFFSGAAMYRVFRRELDPHVHRTAIIGCLWVPSVVFWSSALLKEAVAVTGLGMAIYGGYAFATRRRPVLGLLLFVLGVTVAAPVKPYVLIPFGLAAGIWLYLDGPRPAHRRRSREIRPGALLVGAALAVVFILGIGELFPRFNPAELAETTAGMQGAVEKTKGGSDYRIGDPGAQSFTAQLTFAPVAMLTALFRPTLFEVRNAQMAVNALECTAVTILFIMALWRSGPAGFIRATFGSPVIAFCAVYVLGLALGVGLGSTNLGSLSRYRIPMMPFFVTMVGILARRQARQAVWIDPAPGRASFVR